MKKFISIFVVMMLICSSLPIFAYESAHDTESFVNGTEYEYSLKKIGVKPYQISSASCTAATYTASTNKTTMTVFKLPLPEIADSQTIANYKFRFCSSSNGDQTVYNRVVGLDNLDWSKVEDGSINLTQEPLASAFADYETYTAYSSVESVLCENYADTYYYYYDITEYANKCRANGQDAIYIGVFHAYTRKVYAFTDSGFASDDERIPYTYFTTGEVPPIEFVSSNVNEKKPFVNSADDAVIFTFSEIVESATATVNGNEFACLTDGKKVSVSGLDDFSKCIVSVTAKDKIGNEATASATVYTSYFPGYDGFGYLTTPSRIINASENKTSTHNPSTSKTQVVLWKVALPELEEGKLFESFKLRFLSPVSYGEAYNFFKLPGDLDVENLIFTNNETPEGKTNIADYANNYNYYKADTGLKFSETTDLTWSDKDNGFLEASYADFTEYANECLLNGQTHMYIGIRSNSTQAITGVGNSTLAPAGQVHYYYWKTKDADSHIFTPEFVAVDDESETALSTLVQGGSYKFNAKVSNFEDADKNLNLIIAKYSTKGKLIAVKTKVVTVPGNSENYKIESKEISFSTKGTVKAFIWDDTELKSAIPYATTISVVEPPLDENETPEAPIE